MKLNHECVRAILLILEEHSEISPEGDWNNLSLSQLLEADSMASHLKANIIYASLKLDEAGLISWSPCEADDGIQDALYDGLTYAGHEYLDAIRSESVWKKVSKKIMENGGSLAFSVIQALAVKQLIG